MKILVWGGDLQDDGELIEVSVQIKGIPPRWCTCEVISHTTKCFEMLLDCYGILKSFGSEQILFGKGDY